jgi:hypothetical protein
VTAAGGAADRADAGGVGERGKLTDRVPVTVEPGACLPAKGGARSADVLVVTAGDRARFLTLTTRELLVL